MRVRFLLPAPVSKLVSDAALAQLVERGLGKSEAAGSSPASSTMVAERKQVSGKVVILVLAGSRPVHYPIPGSFSGRTLGSEPRNGWFESTSRNQLMS